MLSQSNKWRMRYRCWRYRWKSEVPSINFVRNARLAGGTLLDIGANRGIYSIYMTRAAGPSGRVIAFEPQPELKSHLETIKRSFGLDRLQIENIGLSSAAGSLLMRRPKSGSGSASFHIDDANWEELEVPVMRLDDYITQAGIDRVDMIKADVEAHELDVFRGGEATLRRDMPALLFECSEQMATSGEIFAFLYDLGYEGHFYFVPPEDHRSWWHKNRGAYMPARQFAEYEYNRPTVFARNYLFLRRGLDPAAVHRGAADLS